MEILRLATAGLLLFALAAKAEDRPPDWVDPVTGMEFVFVPGGALEMGDVFGDGTPDERPVHTVEVSDFYIGRYEVTQAQWEAVMGSDPSFSETPHPPFPRVQPLPLANPSSVVGPDLPVNRVRWHDAQLFAARLNEKSGETYRLPTEAEWEYAARSGGRREKWAGTSEDARVGDYAWFLRNARLDPHPVGRKKLNALGLYDMSGNVEEWCSDWFVWYPARKKPTYGMTYVSRGGSASDGVPGIRTASRRERLPDPVSSENGFRLVWPGPAPGPERAVPPR